MVFGCLSADHEIERIQNIQLVNLAKSLDMEVTFHRAFDFCTNATTALEEIISIGFDRLLSSGQAKTAENGLPIIGNIRDQAKGRIQIMAGAGVNENNALKISEVEVDALHFTIHHKKNAEKKVGMGFEPEMNEQKLKAIIELF